MKSYWEIVSQTLIIGLEGISSRVLNDALLVLVPQLVYLLNLSLSTGICPTSWKIATVVPLYKGGGKSSMGNYRSISLLPVSGKILKKIVHKVISNHLEANCLLTKFQAGFRKGYSTTSSLTQIMIFLKSSTIRKSQWQSSSTWQRYLILLII